MLFRSVSVSPCTSQSALGTSSSSFSLWFSLTALRLLTFSSATRSLCRFDRCRSSRVLVRDPARSLPRSPSISLAHAYSSVMRWLAFLYRTSALAAAGPESGPAGDDGMFSHKARPRSGVRRGPTDSAGEEDVGDGSAAGDVRVRWGGVRGDADGRARAVGAGAGRSARVATLSREMCREGLCRTLRPDGGASRSRSRLRFPDAVVEQEAAPDPVDAVDAIELLERVRARARAVWMVLPDASEKGEVGGRGERGGSAVGTVGSESWRCSLRSVCRLF